MEEEPEMTDVKWSKPVVVNSPWFGKVSVMGPFHAVTLLMDAWPAMSGPHFLKARIACSAALQGRTNVEEARRFFDLATREAEEHLKQMSMSSGAGRSIGSRPN
jgi:hypothetical protein